MQLNCLPTVSATAIEKEKRMGNKINVVKRFNSNASGKSGVENVKYAYVVSLTICFRDDASWLVAEPSHRKVL